MKIFVETFGYFVAFILYPFSTFCENFRHFDRSEQKLLLFCPTLVLTFLYFALKIKKNQIAITF